MISYSTLFQNCIDIVNKYSSNKTLVLEKICSLLKEKIDSYDWVGYYFIDENEKKLILRSFAGKPTEHEKIPIGKGICGQVALSNKNFMVPDIRKQDNYIACSIDVKSELVVPLFIEGKNIGQIDIDSNTLNPFSKADETFLEFICAKVATLL